MNYYSLQVLLDSDLNARVLRIQDLQGKIELINYIFGSEITDAYMTSNSVYWTKYNVISPTIIAPTIHSDGGATVPQSDYAIQSLGVVATQWQNIVDDIRVNVLNYTYT